ncbi:MAG: M67 family metallopeptidase [Planctomycetota bacterium]|jgi:proteasome lid subunit RPN8/RPN11
MLRIPKGIVEEMVAQAEAAAPIEACGLLGGSDGLVATYYPMENADASSDHFTLVPKEQFAVIKEMRAKGETMQAIHHSHPATPSRPSEEDKRLALTPGATYTILSLAGEEPVIKGFTIDDTEVLEVALEII